MIDNIENRNQVLRLWNCEPYLADERLPTWIWNFEYIHGTNKLKVPIIHPAREDWKLQLEINNVIVKQGKIKSFENSIFFNNFLIISSID
jgi:hypothetical protein